MNALQDLQTWNRAQCDGDWEHSYGIEIGTLDNPGWSLTVDLTYTALSGKPFAVKTYGTGADAESSGDNWLHCNVENDKFVASGGPDKLDEMIVIFLAWASRVV
jgi:hypothetical protein